MAIRMDCGGGQAWPTWLEILIHVDLRPCGSSSIWIFIHGASDLAKRTSSKRPTKHVWNQTRESWAGNQSQREVVVSHPRRRARHRFQAMLRNTIGAKKLAYAIWEEGIPTGNWLQPATTFGRALDCAGNLSTPSEHQACPHFG